MEYPGPDLKGEAFGFGICTTKIVNTRSVNANLSGGNVGYAAKFSGLPTRYNALRF